MTSSDGYYSFSGLPSGTYHVCLVPQSGRRLTTSGNGSFTVSVAPSQPVGNLGVGTVAAVNPQLQLPARLGADQFTVYRNGSRVEVFDSQVGTLASYPLANLDSLTISAPAKGAATLTLDLRSLPFFTLPGGLTLQGGSQDALGVLLGPGQDRIFSNPRRLTIDAGLTLHWAGTSKLSIQSGAGNDLLVWNAGSGSITYDGKSGVDTVLAVGSASSPTTMNVGPSKQSVTVQVARSQPAALNLGSTEIVDLALPGPSNAVTVTPLANTTVNVNGGTGNTRLVVERAAAGTSSFTYQGPFAGQWVFSRAKPVSFQNVPTFNAPDPVLYVLGLYHRLLVPQPQVAELNFAVHALQAGVTRSQLAGALLNSPEYLGKEVNQIHLQYPGRPADAPSRSYWIGVLQKGATATSITTQMVV